MKLACVRRHYPQWLASFFFPLPHGVHRKQGHYPGGLKKERERKKKREREAGVYTSHILKPEKEKKKKGHAQIVKTAEGGKRETR